MIAQEYLPAARDGDKRILMVDGEPIGAILRVHAEGQELNNMDMGGEPVPCELDENDRAICAALKPYLVEKNAFFVGIDVIGGKLIEINVTSPTGLQELSRFSGVDFHHDIIRKLESSPGKVLAGKRRAADLPADSSMRLLTGLSQSTRPCS